MSNPERFLVAGAGSRSPRFLRRVASDDVIGSPGLGWASRFHNGHLYLSDTGPDYFNGSICVFSRDLDLVDRIHAPPCSLFYKFGYSIGVADNVLAIGCVALNDREYERAMEFCSPFDPAPVEDEYSCFSRSDIHSTENEWCVPIDDGDDPIPSYLLYLYSGDGRFRRRIAIPGRANKNPGRLFIAAGEGRIVVSTDDSARRGVFVFNLDGDLLCVIKNPYPSLNHFGSYVDISHSRIFVGFPHEEKFGNVAVFDLQGSLVDQINLDERFAKDISDFGSQFAIGDNHLAIEAEYKFTRKVFLLRSDGSYVGDITSNDDYDEGFAFAYAFIGNRLIVGCTEDHGGIVRAFDFEGREIWTIPFDRKHEVEMFGVSVLGDARTLYVLDIFGVWSYSLE